MEGEKIKGVSVGTWIAIFAMFVNLGFTYGVINSQINVLENTIQRYEKDSEKDRQEQKRILQNLTENQKMTAQNAQEIRHLREMNELEEKLKK